MNKFFLLITLISSISNAGFLDQFVGHYYTIEGKSALCEKDNVIVPCEQKIETVDISVINEANKMFQVVVNGTEMNKFSFGSGNGDDSDESMLSGAVVSQSKSKIMCTWTTDQGLFFPTLRKVTISESVSPFIEVKVYNENKGDVLGQRFYRQSGLEVTLKKAKEIKR